MNLHARLILVAALQKITAIPTTVRLWLTVSLYHARLGVGKLPVVSVRFWPMAVIKINKINTI
jgi:hypothetical protein